VDTTLLDGPSGWSTSFAPKPTIAAGCGFPCSTASSASGSRGGPAHERGICAALAAGAVPVALQPDDWLVLHTDGIAEARNHTGERATSRPACAVRSG
jgi:hypothetical protein